MISLRFDAFINLLTKLALLRNTEQKIIRYDVMYNDEVGLVRLVITDVNKKNKTGEVVMSRDEYNKNLETWNDQEIAERLLSIAFDKLLGKENK